LPTGGAEDDGAKGRWVVRGTKPNPGVGVWGEWAMALPFVMDVLIYVARFSEVHEIAV
jgi:hypothetical protein